MEDAMGPILGASRAANEIRDFARLAARVDAPVLITGETGTGKGALAEAIHRLSGRSAAQLIAVNCAGVPESLFESEFFGHARGAFTGAHSARRGLFEQAHGGTLFLDEIGELTLPLQAKLLTSIESGEVRRLGAEGVRHVETRIVAATGVDLDEAVVTGTFRMDLYHRLLVLSFHMPPLRDRGGDRGLLARHFVCTFAARHNRRVGDLDAATIRLIESHPWPGNIRQLAHAIEAAVLVAAGPSIKPTDLPKRLLRQAIAGTASSGTAASASAVSAADTASGTGASATSQLERYSFYGTTAEERQAITAALRAHQGNMTRTARSLGMSRNTLRSRMVELDIPSTRRPRGSLQ